MARPKKEKKEFQIPTNPRELQDIRDTIFTIEGHLSILEKRKEDMKASYELLKEKYGMPAKTVKQWVEAHRNDKFEEMKESNDQFSDGYEKIMSLEVSEEVQDLHDALLESE